MTQLMSGSQGRDWLTRGALARASVSERFDAHLDVMSRDAKPHSGTSRWTRFWGTDVEAVALSQSKTLRRLALIDKNRDLYITPVQGSQELYKLHIMVDSVRWNDADNALAAVADGQVLAWHYP